MKKYSYVFFDLDGTITDPGEGITNSVMYALKKYGIEVAKRSELYKFIGPPLKESFMKYYGFDEQTAQQAIGYYREYFTEKGMFENMVYDGIEKLLKDLKNNNIDMILATSKPESFAISILEHFHLAHYFTVIAGSNLDGSRVKKADVIQYAMEQYGLHTINGAVMVGDCEHDIIGAKANGLPSIGVLYGYGDRRELEEAGADYLAGMPEELGEIILN